MTFKSKLLPLDRVRIDGGDIIGIVTGVTFYAGGDCSGLVSWLANGAHYEVWFDEKRLEVVE